MLIIISYAVCTYPYQADIFPSPATKARLHGLTLLATALHASYLFTIVELTSYCGQTPADHVLRARESHLKIIPTKKRQKRPPKLETIENCRWDVLADTPQTANTAPVIMTC